MKLEEYYCPICRKKTLHKIFKDCEDAERFFSAIFSFGLSEILNQTYIKCTECGNYL